MTRRRKADWLGRRHVGKRYEAGVTTPDVEHRETRVRRRVRLNREHDTASARHRNRFADFAKQRVDRRADRVIHPQRFGDAGANRDASELLPPPAIYESIVSDAYGQHRVVQWADRTTAQRHRLDRPPITKHERLAIG